MKTKRQEIDDLSPLNKFTGLPKHVYWYNHKQCNRVALVGKFNMKGKKYNTATVRVDDFDTEAEAVEAVVEQLEKLKYDLNYYDYVLNKEYLRGITSGFSVSNEPLLSEHIVTIDNSNRIRRHIPQ